MAEQNPCQLLWGLEHMLSTRHHQNWPTEDEAPEQLLHRSAKLVVSFVTSVEYDGAGFWRADSMKAVLGLPLVRWRNFPNCHRTNRSTRHWDCAFFGMCHTSTRHWMTQPSRVLSGEESASLWSGAPEVW